MDQEITELRKELAEKNRRIEVLEKRLLTYETVENIKVSPGTNLSKINREPELNNNDIAKFSRQIILPEFRVRSQKKLKVGS